MFPAALLLKKYQQGREPNNFGNFSTMCAEVAAASTAASMQQHAAIGAERGEEGDISIWYDNVTHVYICTDDSSSALCMRVKTASISVSLKKPMKTKQNSPVMRDDASQWLSEPNTTMFIEISICHHHDMTT